MRLEGLCSGKKIDGIVWFQKVPFKERRLFFSTSPFCCWPSPFSPSWILFYHRCVGVSGDLAVFVSITKIFFGFSSVGAEEERKIFPFSFCCCCVIVVVSETSVAIFSQVSSGFSEKH